MSIQSTKRRFFLGVLLMMLAVLAAVGDSQSVSAEAKYVGGYGSVEEFKRDCARKGGTFVVGASGELACRLGDGSIVCDHRGNNCWFYPSAPRNSGVYEEANDEANGEAVVLGTGGGLPVKEPGNVSSVDIPEGSGGSPNGDIDVGPGDNVAAP